jgi:hypothetical protein
MLVCSDCHQPGHVDEWGRKTGPCSGNAPFTTDEMYDEINKIVEDWNKALLSSKDAMNQIADLFKIDA